MRLHLFFEFSFILIYFLIQSSSSAGEEETKILPVLGNAIWPTFYTLLIRPILDPDDPTGTQWTAPGHVDIDFKVLENTNQIVFTKHPTLTIVFESVQVVEKYYRYKKKYFKNIPIGSYSFDETSHFYTIVLEKELQKGHKYTISMDFIAEISTGTKGMYRIIITNPDGSEHRGATTDLEKSDARRVFPSFDEPRFKTPFKISVGRKDDARIALSNARKKLAGAPYPELEGWVWDHFETTVKMSTYLVAIVVADFTFVQAEKYLFPGRPVRVYGEPRYIAPDGNTDIGGGNFAVEASARFLKYLEDSLEYRYNMKKVDSVGIPRASYATATVAMENWGLNTYRDNPYLFIFEGEQSSTNRKQVLTTVAHETAHNWFGNLVTPNNWADLWLNEGFAGYVSAIALYAIFPEWDDIRWNLWASQQFSMDVDITNEEPIRSELAPGEIIYEKAGSILHMVESFLTMDTMHRGLVEYLQKYAYEAVDQYQLFAILTKVALEDYRLPPYTTIADILDTWTLQPGFPLVRVAAAVGGEQVSLTQERFLPAGTIPNVTLFYYVPISTAEEGGKVFSDFTVKVWLTPSNPAAFIPHDTSTWIFVNPDGVGYYRVLYDATLLQLLQDNIQINRNVITGLSRSVLLDDYFASWENDLVELETALSNLKWIQNQVDIELDFIVWYPIFTRLAKAFAMFFYVSNGLENSLVSYFGLRISIAAELIGWLPREENEGVIALLRGKFLAWTCPYIIGPTNRCSEIALQLLEQWIANPEVNPFPVDVRPYMFSAIVAEGVSTNVDFLLSQLETAPQGEFKTLRIDLLTSLASVRDDASLVPRLLEMALDVSTAIGRVAEDAANLITLLAANVIGRGLILPFLEDNFNVLIERHGGISFISTVLTSLSTAIYTEDQLEAFLAFVASHQPELEPEQAAIDAAVKTIQDNIKYRTENFERMDQWFKDNLPSTVYD